MGTTMGIMVMVTTMIMDMTIDTIEHDEHHGHTR